MKINCDEVKTFGDLGIDATAVAQEVEFVAAAIRTASGAVKGSTLRPMLERLGFSPFLDSSEFPSCWLGNGVHLEVHGLTSGLLRTWPMSDTERDVWHRRQERTDA